MDSFHSLDPNNMFQSIYDFPDHIKEAIKIGENIFLNNKYDNIQNIVIVGMGGSAIGGDIVRLLAKDEINVPIVISRNYTLPNWIDNKSLVICSSYSGNTEESLAAFYQAREKGSQIIGISTGGILTQQINDLDLDIVLIPSGLQPRAALAFSFVPMLYLLKAIDLIGLHPINELKIGMKLINSVRDSYSKELESNLTYALAKRIYKSLPVIYGENESTGIVAVRWKGQLSENAKMLAYHNELPEMNHNEIVGWENNSELINKISIVWLKDKDDHTRISIRQSLTKDIIGELAGNHEIVSVTGDSKIQRYLHMIHFGDWVSFWCAILHKTNPTPVNKIDQLKEILSKES